MTASQDLTMSLGIYVHIPFCARRCDYCDFFLVVGREGADGFFAWLREDLAASAASLPEPRPGVDSIYLGGGTPSYVEPVEIARFLQECARLFRIEQGAEVTLEANPESVTPERCRAWLAGGINRLSLGVQSFNDRALPARGRLYTAAQAAGAARLARRCGVANLGIDLIAGLPGEAPRSFLGGVERAIGLQPDHLSVYLIETEDAGKQTPLARAVASGRERLPDDEAILAMYEGAVQRLTGSGYRHYEISNFARAGFESRHNLRYWTSRPWLGVGPSAHSYLLGRRYGRPADMPAWIEQVRAGAAHPAAGDYTLPRPDQRAREALVLALRLIEGVDLGRFAEEWRYDPSTVLAAEIGELAEQGLLKLEGGVLRLTRAGILLSNEVFARLM